MSRKMTKNKSSCEGGGRRIKDSFSQNKKSFWIRGSAENACSKLGHAEAFCISFLPLPLTNYTWLEAMQIRYLLVS